MADKDMRMQSRLKQYQAYQAMIRGLPLRDIATAVGDSERNIMRLIRKEAEDSSFQFDLDAQKKITLDKLDVVIATCYKELNQISSSSLNKSGLMGQIIRAIELQAKISGLMVNVNKHVGEDGGPIKIEAISNREEALKELEARFSQMKAFELPRVIEHEENPES